MRRRMMRAWANGSPQDAGPDILPLIEGGLQDADYDVRMQAVAVLQQLERAANMARIRKQSIKSDPSRRGRRRQGAADVPVLYVGPA
jgi:hypothetical protein